MTLSDLLFIDWMSAVVLAVVVCHSDKIANPFIWHLTNPANE